MRNLPFALILFFQLFGTKCISQTDSQTQKRIIEGVGEDLMWGYVDVNMAIKMAGFLTKKYEAGAYDTSLNIDEFTFEITKDLRQLSKDTLTV